MAILVKFPSRMAMVVVTAAAILLPVDQAPAQEPGDWQGLLNRINRLQEQVYDLNDRGFGGSSSQQQDSNSASQAELALRVDNVEGQMRNLTGQIERVAYEIQQLNERFTRFSEDVEFRFRENSGGVGQSGNLSPNGKKQGAGKKVADGKRRQPKQNGSSGAASARLQPQGAVLDGGSDSAGESVRLSKAPGPSVLGTIPAAGQQTASLVPEAVTSQPLDGDPPSDADGLYEDSHEKMLRRQFNAAEAGFKKFLSAYPKNKLASNAQYWLGETYYARRQYKRAAKAFLTGYKKHNKSSKAPDYLVKLGMTLARLGQKKQACATLLEAGKRYPKSPAVRKVAKKEQVRVGC